MPACRICRHDFNSFKFKTEHISICTRCVNTLNDSPEPARNSEVLLAEKLARGMQRNAEAELHADEEWKRHKANRTLANLDAAVAAALHDWITRLLSKTENSTRDFKIMRAHRRGLLRAEGFADYPKEWADVAHRIQHRDDYKCTSCGAIDTTLDVHHIIYLSNHGTNQQSNLITLCRKCHEAEHERIFDWPEAKDPESVDPIRPSPELQTSALFSATIPPPVISKIDVASTILSGMAASSQPRTELSCPTFLTELTISSNFALSGKIVRCPKCTVTFDFGKTLLHTPPKNMAAPEPVVRISTQSVAQPRSLPSDVSLAVTQNPNVMSTSKQSKPVTMRTTNLRVFLVMALALIFIFSLVMR